MDCMKEIWDRSLPNFGYVIDKDDGGLYVVVLGGQSIPKSEDSRFLEPICRRNEQMQKIYSQESLSDDDKKELAELMHKMFSICESRMEGLYTREEQESFIDGLSDNERKQLEIQIQMLKDCRSFYHDYIFRG